MAINNLIDFTLHQSLPTPAAIKLAQEFLDDILADSIRPLAALIVFVDSDSLIYYRMSDTTGEETAVTMCNTVNVVLGFQMSGDAE